jgi:hypothetical protein
MKNLEDVLRYVERALSTKDISDLQVAYEIMAENQRREAGQPDVKEKIAEEIKDFDQDAIAVMKQRKKEDVKIKKQLQKISPIIKRSISKPKTTIAPKPTRRRRRGRRVNVGKLLANRAK